MKYFIKRAIVWLTRFTHSRGFGVQSPTAYRFLRYVVNEHYPYYAYDDMLKSVPELDNRRRKLCRLYFRIANFRQAGKWLIYGEDSDAYAKYIKAGSNKSVFVSCVEDGETVEAALISTRANYKSVYEEIVAHSDEKTILVIQHIKRNPLTRMFWNNIVSDQRTGITFDLYYCGIVMFDKKVHKQNYKVNF
jgi:hypothetical protein